MKLFIGIDNGMNGGLVAMNHTGRLEGSVVMPMIGKECDLIKIEEWVNSLLGDIALIVIEDCIAMPKQSSQSTATTFKNYGQLLGMLKTKKLPFQVVSSREWMKTILRGMPKKDKKDKPSIPYVLRKYPTHIWKATERCKVYHDGLTDACCIAEYAKLLFNQS